MWTEFYRSIWWAPNTEYNTKPVYQAIESPFPSLFQSACLWCLLPFFQPDLSFEVVWNMHLKPSTMLGTFVWSVSCFNKDLELWKHKQTFIFLPEKREGETCPTGSPPSSLSLWFNVLPLPLREKDVSSCCSYTVVESSNGIGIYLFWMARIQMALSMTLTAVWGCITQFSWTGNAEKCCTFIRFGLLSHCTLRSSGPNCQVNVTQLQ